MPAFIRGGPESGRVSIANMEAGQFGATEGGRLFYRTYDSAACLTNPGESYTGNANAIREVMVRVLPAGTIFEIAAE
jgi:hypothetical protein